MADDASSPPIPPADSGGIAPISIEAELKKSYLDYAMSVIVARALPDVRDGLKPVHRRILYSMNEENRTPDRPYVKSARIVGDVMGKYHPHGDVAIYDSLVRMAQPFAMGLVLIDGQGNFGSQDNDPPAHMRYTEARLARPAMSLLADIDKDTVDFQPNYDGSEREPLVLPARIPNLLVNGAQGIAVGMATNIPPHNLGEVVDACLALVDDPTTEMERLLELVPGPDFPTGGEIIGRSGARLALMTGRGSVIMRGRSHTEQVHGREALILDDMPYQLNKATLVERLGELVREKKIEGVAAVRDETNRRGVRVVIELRRDASPEVVLNQVYRFTPFQSSFGVNALALNLGRPEQMGLRAMLDAFLAFREEVVVRRTKFELTAARNRGHTLVGLAIAVVNIDEVIRIIRSSANPTEARERLVAAAWPIGDMAPLIALIADPRTRVLEDGRLRLSDDQARSILALTLSRLTGLGREEIFAEAGELANSIRELLEILGSRERIMGIVRAELVEVRERFAVPRRTEIVEGEAELEDEDLIPREEMVVTVTHGGYVKRTQLSAYRTQHRGGKGKSGMNMKEEDAVTRIFSASTHAPVLFFSSEGQVYKLKVWRLPLAQANARGRSFNNLLPIQEGERITTILPLPEDPAAWERLDVMFATTAGNVRRNRLSDFVNVNRAGKIAMKLDEGEHIVGVSLCNAGEDVLLTSALGRAIRFSVGDVRVFAGRDSNGVRGIRLAEGDRVISTAVLRHVEATPAERAAYLRYAAQKRLALGQADDAEAVEAEAAEVEAEEAVDASEEQAVTQERLISLEAAEQFILTVADDGRGKRTSAYEYRSGNRGNSGVRAYDAARIEGGARLAAGFPVENDDQLLLVTDAGQLIRTPVANVSTRSRASGGVYILRTDVAERVVSVERLEGDDGEADAPPEGEGI